MITNKGESRKSALGLGVVCRGRLVGYHASPEAGELAELLTRPFMLDRPQLRINADAANGGVKVTVATEDGLPISGFSAKDAQPIREDSLGLPL